ncbi:ATP-binding protein [Massilia sp. 9096]|uniref:sensor histidine kinase n=1 Tax=Massilia sp. 9096 TaxID=1500894 RepID=UPI0018CDE4E4|nr:ATP-binding protein [Massilia sp. 9096]
MPRSLRDLGISTQLTLLLAGLVVLITLVLAGVLDVLFTQREKQDIGQQFAELAIQATDKLDRSLFERYREVQILASQPGLGRADTLDDKRRLLEDMQKTYAYYAWLGLTDREGRVLVSANRVLEGVDVSKRPWFGRALQGIHLTDVHEAALLDKLLRKGPNASQEPLRFIDVAFPYRDPQGRIAGMFGTHLSLAWAADIERSVMLPLLRRSGAETLILAPDMRVIIGPRQLVGTRLSLPDLAAPGAYANGYAVKRFADDKRYLVGYSKTQGYGASPGLGWTVMVRQDLDLAYAPVVRLRHQGMLAGAVIAALFAALAWVLARRVARPLGAIAESARRIEAMDTDRIDAVDAGYREIGVLRSALQSLIGKLQANQASLREADRRKDEFLATLAHELRNPLAPISAAADLLGMGRADDAQQRRLGGMIARQVRHMTGMVDDLLDVSRVTRGQFTLARQALDLRDVVAEAMEQNAPLAAAKRHRIDTLLAPEPALVLGDRKRLVQVVANLLDNAVRYTPADGRIELALAARDNRVLLSVRDHGIGMSSDLMAHLFELFTQETRKTDLSGGGLGVGLALSRRLVEQHGGTVTASSAGRGQGSEFVVSLPALPAGADAAVPDPVRTLPDPIRSPAEPTLDTQRGQIG